MLARLVRRDAVEMYFGKKYADFEFQVQNYADMEKLRVECPSFARLLPWVRGRFHMHPPHRTRKDQGGRAA